MTSGGRGIGTILLAIALLPVVGYGSARPSDSYTADDDFFLFSVWYSGGLARAPMLEEVDEGSRERWRADLEQIRDLGFNTVRTWVEWTAGEPRPGEYRFENLELLGELTNELGLKLFVQVYVDSAPDWVGREFEGAEFVAQNDAAIPSQAAPGYCFDHAGVREKILNFYREAAKAASRFPNFVGWDLWSEPHIINWAIIDYIPNATFCYCAHTQARFRSWLRDRHGDLESLNRAWYRTFTEWGQVEAPRFGTILSYTDFIDWRIFVQRKLAEDLRMRAEAVRSVDPTRVVTSHAAVPALVTSPLMGVGAPDDWLMADAVDYWGTSAYPKHSFPERHWSRLTFSSLADFAGSSGRLNDGFFVGELQAGRGIRGTVVGDPITAADQKFWTLGLLSRGARAINIYAYYPMSSGYEAGGYGLIELDGSLTERSRRLGELARMVSNRASLFKRAKPQKAEAALIYNPLAYMVGGEQHLAPAGVVRESLVGYYHFFWQNNIPVDFVHLNEVSAGGLSAYRFAILPYPLMLTADAAAQLGEFVRNGGTLLAEARAGWNDDRGFSQHVIPGFGLHEVFGVRETELRMVDRIDLTLEAQDAPLPGRGIEASWEIQDESVEVLARFPHGAPAVTRNAYGDGTAIAAGTFLGLTAAREIPPGFSQFLSSIVRELGVEAAAPASRKDDSWVEVRRLQTRGSELLYLFHHGTESVRPELPFPSALDLETGQTVDLTGLELSPGECRVFLVSP